MGFFFRDHLNIGKFLKLNFSKSGIGISGGIKGLRIGTGPKGAYLHAGRNGLYYRKSLNEKTEVKEKESLITLILKKFYIAIVFSIAIFKKLDLKFKILIIAAIAAYIIFVPKIETAYLKTDFKVCKNEYYCKTYKKFDEIKVAKTNQNLYTVYDKTNNVIGKIEANNVVFPETTEYKKFFKTTNE